MIAERSPIRLPHLADDPRSVGFPVHHPAMDSFLGVPIRVGDDVYGNLYLADTTRGPFTDDDQDLVVALAATAGIAIENARLYDAARAREVWSATTADVMAAMLEATGDDVLEIIAEHVGSLIDVDLVVVTVPHADDALRVKTVHGSNAAPWRGRVIPAAGTLASRALATRRAASVDRHPPIFDGQPELGPTVAIPLFSGDEPLGVLTVSRRPHSPAFTDADLDMAFAFAGQAGVAIEVVRAREDRRRLEITRDRARIARDLHDHVIQRLFGAGLSLQAVSATVDDEASAAIEQQIDAVDAAIKDIRTAIFALGSEDRGRSRRARDRMLNVVSEMSTILPMSPRITFRRRAGLPRRCVPRRGPVRGPPRVSHERLQARGCRRRRGRRPHRRRRRHPRGGGRRARHPPVRSAKRPGEHDRAGALARRILHDLRPRRRRHTRDVVGPAELVQEGQSS